MRVSLCVRVCVCAYSARKMFLLTSTLIFISAVVSQCEAEQTLECKYTSEDKDLPRVWCKQDANNHSCCTGFSFSTTNQQLGNDHLSVQDDGQAFTVAVKSLPHGDGVYWCGLRKDSNVIIKLAEIKLYNPMDLVWSIVRWLLFTCLLVAVISTHLCCRGKKEKE